MDNVPADSAFSRTAYVWVGIALIAGFLSPVMVQLGSRSTEFVFPNILGLQERGPAMLKFQVVYPLIAGVLVLIAVNVARGMTRAVWMLSLGLLPFLALFLADDAVFNFSRTLRDVGSQSGTLFGGGALGLIAFTCLFIGNRACIERPLSRAAVAIAATGAVAYLVSLLLTVPGTDGMLAVTLPFRIVFGGAPVGRPAIITIFGLTMIVQMGCMIAASIMSLTNTRRREDNEAVARRALLLWKIAFGAAVGGVLLILFQALGDNSAITSAVISILIKVALWVGALFLLLLMGGTDVVVAAAPSAASPASRPERSGYDRLQALQKIFDDGLMTADEYERKRAQILAEL